MRWTKHWCQKICTIFDISHYEKFFYQIPVTQWKIYLGDSSFGVGVLVISIPTTSLWQIFSCRLRSFSKKLPSVIFWGKWNTPSFYIFNCDCFNYNLVKTNALQKWFLSIVEFNSKMKTFLQNEWVYLLALNDGTWEITFCNNAAVTIDKP